MRSTRLAGLGLAAALLAGGAAIAPAVTAPADAAVVAPVVVAASKPKFKTNLPSRKIVKVNKYTTLKVKATGGDITYQWYYAAYDDWFFKKVSGKAGKRSYLKVKATLAKSGGQYMVIIGNSNSTKRSRPATILVKNSAAKPFGLNKRGVTAHWSFRPSTMSARALDGGKTLLRMLVTPRNETTKNRNPKGKVTIAFRDKNGKIWSDRNANGTFLAKYIGWNSKGINKVGSVPKGSTRYTAYAAVVVPTSVAAGGRWIITDKASPAMKLYFKLG